MIKEISEYRGYWNDKNSLGDIKESLKVKVDELLPNASSYFKGDNI